MRLLTSHILSLFSPTVPDPVEGIPDVPLFTVILKAEKTSDSIFTYRETLNHLQKLHANVVHHLLPTSGVYNEVTLNVLLFTVDRMVTNHIAKIYTMARVRRMERTKFLL